MERPNDPLSFISLYLLKHKNDVTIPKKRVKVDENIIVADANVEEVVVEEQVESAKEIAK